MAQILSAPSVDVQGGLSDMLRTILLFLPKALLFVLILVVGYIVAKVLLKVVDKALERVGFDRVVERGGIRAALAHSKYDASDIVAKLVYYAVLLFTLQLAFGVWGPNPVSALLNDIIAWLPNAFVAIVIVVIAAAIGAVLNATLEELYWRGALIPEPTPRSAAVSLAAFTAAHVIWLGALGLETGAAPMATFAAALALGGVWTAARLVTGTLGAGVLSHAGFNLFAFAQVLALNL